MIDACKVCIEQYDKKKKENKISKIYEEVLKLRDEAEKIINLITLKLNMLVIQNVFILLEII